MARATLVVVLGACGGGGPTPPPPTSFTETNPPATQQAAATEAPSAAAATAEPAPAVNGARITFENGDLALGAMIWKPAGHGPFRAVLWNHGTTNQDGHEFAVRGSDAWDAEVFAFLTAAFGG